MIGNLFGRSPIRPMQQHMQAAVSCERAIVPLFDAMVAGFGLATEPMLRLAAIVRGADTARLDLAPEAAGLLAVSLGLSQMVADDLAQLDAGMALYDALYRWARDAADETHNWPSAAAGGPR